MNCIRNSKTKRCRKSVLSNITSSTCVYSKKTKRCKTIKKKPMDKKNEFKKWK